MADEAEFGPETADSAVTDDHPMGIDPRLSTDDGGEPAPVWASAQRLRELVERQQAQPPAADRRLLTDEALRQLTTLGLYREVVKVFTGPIDPRSTISMFVLLFPGEGRDNTGLKELNDKVLGYRLHTEFIAARQEEIRGIFPPPDDRTGPRYITVGQDYKTASIVAVQKTPEEFAKDLVTLDGRLRQRLLEFLDRAARETKDAKRLDAIRTLRRTLEKNKDYRFDFLFGTNTLRVRGKPVDVTFQLLTEALKGAGIARFAAKGGRNLPFGVARDMAKRGVEKVPKGHDPRGRAFDPDVFLRVLETAEDIRHLMAKAPHRDQPLDFRAVYVDTVWTTTFLRHSAMDFGNPDVIRDVRKKLLEKPQLPNVKYSFEAQKGLLELFLVTLNMLDFIKDFASPEYPRFVELYHNEALLILEQLMDKAAPPIDWGRLARFLTHDSRQTFEPVAIQGAASEFLFYGYASDLPEQIFFSMDIRDLGVELMAFYEATEFLVVDRGLTGQDLMVQTFIATDDIVTRRRFTYDAVVAAFKNHYVAAARAGAAAAAAQAFGTGLRVTGPMPDFRDSVRVMLGGDEVFVAAHPYYAHVEHLIIAELAKTPFQGDRDRLLNMRVGVAYSSAARAPGPAPTGSAVSPAQRKENQKAHDRAMKLSADSLNELKPLERAQRRIERLIEMLENNPKKKDLAPGYATRLADLHLLELYGRVKHRHAIPLSPALYSRLHGLLRAGNLAGALDTKLFELVDFAGNVVDGYKLARQLAELEAAVRKDVGNDNIHIDGPPVTKVPKLIQKIIDYFLPKQKPRPPAAGKVIVT